MLHPRTIICRDSHGVYVGLGVVLYLRGEQIQGIGDAVLWARCWRIM